jgi:hypothetical protein
MSIFDFFPSAAVDVVGVYDEAFNQIFAAARPIKATVSETAKIMEHPVESGATIADHRVIQPTEIELGLILTPDTYWDTYQEIRSAWLATSLLSVQTRTGSYSDMLIYEIPHDEDPEMSDTIAVAVKLRQVILVDAQYEQLPAAKVANPSDSSTVKTGQKSGDAATGADTEKGSVLFGILN